MPEPINRLLTDSISDLLFVTDESALGNLRLASYHQGGEFSANSPARVGFGFRGLRMRPAARIIEILTARLWGHGALVISSRTRQIQENAR
jgi:hypothetical protein